MYELILIATGYITWGWLLYHFLMKHIAWGVIRACRACWWLMWVDFLDPTQCRVDFSRHFNNWDKLWMVPQHFGYQFLAGFRESLRWY